MKDDKEISRSIENLFLLSSPWDLKVTDRNRELRSFSDLKLRGNTITQDFQFEVKIPLHTEKYHSHHIKINNKSFSLNNNISFCVERYPDFEPPTIFEYTIYFGESGIPISESPDDSNHILLSDVSEVLIKVFPHNGKNWKIPMTHSQGIFDEIHIKDNTITLG